MLWAHFLTGMELNSEGVVNMLDAFLSASREITAPHFQVAITTFAEMLQHPQNPRRSFVLEAWDVIDSKHRLMTSCTNLDCKDVLRMICAAEPLPEPEFHTIDDVREWRRRMAPPGCGI